MTGFQLFDRKHHGQGPAKMGMNVTVTKLGQINMSGEAHEKLGHPQYAEFLYDPTRKVFAIRPAQDISNGYKFRKPAKSGYTMVFAKPALDAYGIDYTLTRRYASWVEDNLLCIDVSASR
jgi:hypothetical protein